MRSFLSMVVLAAAFSLLVPDNGAQAVKAAEGARHAPAGAALGAPEAPALLPRHAPDGMPATTPDVAWLLALGFLGAVMARRMRAD